jgi:hypothetical protein
VPPKPLLDEPYVPQLSSTGLDLSGLIEGFGPHEAQGLSVSEIVDTLTKWGPEKGFSRESKRCGEPLLRPRIRPSYVRNQRGAAASPDQR